MALYSQLFASLSLIGLKFSLSASAEFTFLGLPKIISFSASCVTGTGRLGGAGGGGGLSQSITEKYFE